MKKECIYKGGVYCLNRNNESAYCEFIKQEEKCSYAKEQEKE